MTALQDLSLAELLEKYPNSRAVLADFNLLGYAETSTASHESIQASAIVNQVDYDALMKALNAVL